LAVRTVLKCPVEKRKARVLAAVERWPKVFYALFARAGFTPDLQAAAAAEGTRLVQAAALCRE
jgi:hypothetical protein